MSSWPIIRVQNRQTSESGDPGDPLPLSVRVRLEDELTRAWREFRKGHRPLGPDAHEEFWRHVITTGASA